MEKLAKNKTAPGRYALLDELRGLDLVSMMLYHACWDLVFLFGVQMNWYAATPGHLWQQSICWVFTRGGSILPIISRWCRGCFCSGAAISCTGSWAAHAWNRCAVRSAPRLAGWGGIRWCCICCISRSSLGCFGPSSKFFTKKA